jgi:type I restriction enzyme S subunit
VRFPAYPKYKPSGVEWLGDVPEHGEVKRLDFLATVKARLGWKGLTADEYVPEGYIFLATPNIKGESEIDFQSANYITAERYFESPEIMLREGDVLMAKDGSTLGIVNVVHHLPAPATVNGSIAVLRPKGKVESSFLFRWLSGAYVQSVVHSMKDGQGVPHLFQADIRKFSVLLPSTCEQRVIADFLDTETAKLDTLVAKRRELIEKLKEKRSALISRTVMRGLPPEAARAAGLDPNPKLKPSSIEWLGEIPEHWRESRIRFETVLVSKGTTPSTIGKAVVDEGIRFIKAENIRGGKVLPEPEFFIDDNTDKLLARSRLKGGDTLLVIAGATTGRAATLPQNLVPANTNQAVCFIRLKNTGYASILAAWISTKFIQDIVWNSAVQAAQPNLAMEDIKGFPCLVPPICEQQAITGYLDRETMTIDRMVAKVVEAIERLQEYRTALITAAVTGKIDVRNVRHSGENRNPGDSDGYRASPA